jgi:hypothetical protein
VSFAAFFSIWADERGWIVPDVHWIAVHWLEHRGRLAVMRCFRGFAKSTILAIYNAWRYYQDPTYRILHQGDQDKTAFKTSRDTKAVLTRHPLTREHFANGIRGEATFWWVPGSDDERNPSMQAAGITSNITSSRCDEAQNDDVEVPRNIQNPEAREKMRYRLGEQTHCMVPGARQLFVGTPHTHDSLYDEMERMGADCLTIPMFAKEYRIPDVKATVYELPFVPEVVLSGIGSSSRELVKGEDYKVSGKRVQMIATGIMVDFYSGNSWPDRFTPEEMVARRKKCKTVNEWDSQYQLHSRPLHEIRLDPSKLKAYEVEPTLREANRESALWLGMARVVSASCRWDPSSGKLKSDVSSLAIVLQDDRGRRYWHRALELRGEVAEFDGTGKVIVGGQVLQIAQAVKELGLRRVSVETNGIGGFAPAVLKAALKQARIHDCGVAEIQSTGNKNKRILEALEDPLTSGTMWAHVSVLRGPAFTQMRDWNPAIADQPDDHLDSLAGAVGETPERVGPASAGWNAPGKAREDWRPDAGQFEVELQL